MKLVYHKSQTGNFGDDLNAWLWHELLPADFFDDDPRELFYGIGTLLSRGLPQAPLKIIFGTGTGYKKPPVVDASYRIYFVRGPLTAQRLGLPATLAIADPAYLILNTAFARQTVRPEYQAVVIPHHLTMELVDWTQIAKATGIPVIDPRGPCLDVIHKIRAAKLIITESLHGAIVADAFRVPWVPIRISHRFLDFKWADWAHSLDLDITPLNLPPVFHGPLGFGKRTTNFVRNHVARVGLGPASWVRRPYRRSSPAETERFAKALAELAKTGRCCLSGDQTLEQVLVRLTAQVERLSEWQRIGAKGES